jgi:peroxiredoxin
MTAMLAARTAVVTGAGRGVGRAVAIALANHGVTVALVASSYDQLAETADQVKQLPMQRWIRDQDPGQVGPAPYEHFARSYAERAMTTPEIAAASLVDHLCGDDSGQIWDTSPWRRPPRRVLRRSECPRRAVLVHDKRTRTTRMNQGESGMTLLHPGDTFPGLTVTPPGAAALRLPDALAGQFAVVPFFRGAWCPYCKTQLRSFQRAQDNLATVGAPVVALSVDDETTTAQLIADLGLSFPVGHSADADAVAETTGAFVNAAPTYLQSTGFVLDPSGRVIVSVYSSGAIGRLTADDVVGMIRYLRDHAPSGS